MIKELQIIPYDADLYRRVPGKVRPWEEPDYYAGIIGGSAGDRVYYRLAGEEYYGDSKELKVWVSKEVFIKALCTKYKDDVEAMREIVAFTIGRDDAV
jgi:hypothetical protein